MKVLLQVTLTDDQRDVQLLKHVDWPGSGTPLPVPGDYLIVDDMRLKVYMRMIAYDPHEVVPVWFNLEHPVDDIDREYARLRTLGWQDPPDEEDDDGEEQAAPEAGGPGTDDDPGIDHEA